MRKWMQNPVVPTAVALLPLALLIAASATGFAQFWGAIVYVWVPAFYLLLGLCGYLLWLLAGSGLRFRERLLRCVLPLLYGLTVISIVLLQWPFKIAFAVQRPMLETIARQTLRGQTLSLPLRVGTFTVYKAQRDEWGNADLYIDLSPGGSTWLEYGTAQSDHHAIGTYWPLSPQWRLIGKD